MIQVEHMSPFQDNIVCLPKKLASALGNINPILICFKVTQTVHLIDPNTLQGQLTIFINHLRENQKLRENFGTELQQNQRTFKF